MVCRSCGLSVCLSVYLSYHPSTMCFSLIHWQSSCLWIQVLQRKHISTDPWGLWECLEGQTAHGPGKGPHGKKDFALFNWKVWFDLILFPNGSKCLLKMLLLKMMFVWNSCCEILGSFRWVKTRAFQPWKLVFWIKLVLFGEFPRDCFSVFSVALVLVALELNNESFLLRQGSRATHRSEDNTVHFADCSKSTRFLERGPSISTIYLLISTDTLIYEYIM